MNIKLLTKNHWEFLSLTGGCTGLPESTVVKMPHCWKSHVVNKLFTRYFIVCFCFRQKKSINRPMADNRFFRWIQSTRKISQNGKSKVYIIVVTKHVYDMGCNARNPVFGVSNQGSHELWKSWKTWKVMKKSSVREKIMERE